MDAKYTLMGILIGYIVLSEADNYAGTDYFGGYSFGDLTGVKIASGIRGIRNNNPGNVEYDGTAWLGLSDPLATVAFVFSMI